MNKDIEIRIKKFIEDREWDQFHSPANLAKSIVVEASELLENFLWNDDNYDLKNLSEELADVLICSLQLVYKLDLKVEEIINRKMDINEEKYPVQKARGNSLKYTEYDE